MDASSIKLSSESLKWAYYIKLVIDLKTVSNKPLKSAKGTFRLFSSIFNDGKFCQVKIIWCGIYVVIERFYLAISVT